MPPTPPEPKDSRIAELSRREAVATPLARWASLRAKQASNRSLGGRHALQAFPLRAGRARRAARDRRRRGRQGHHRDRRRRLPVLPADRARRAARRVQEGRRRGRDGQLQGRLAGAHRGARRQRRRGVGLFRPLRQSGGQEPGDAGLRGLRPLPRTGAGGGAEEHDDGRLGQGPRRQEGGRQRARLVDAFLPHLPAVQERRRSEFGRRGRRRPRGDRGRRDGAGLDRRRRHARSGGDAAAGQAQRT